MSREVAWTEQCFRKINLGLYDKLIDKSIVSWTVKEVFFLNNPKLVYCTVCISLNWLTF